MSDAIIENPVITAPFEEPARHFRFVEDGITNDIVAGRRVNSCFAPIARPRNHKPWQMRLVKPRRRRERTHPTASLAHLTTHRARCYYSYTD